MRIIVQALTAALLLSVTTAHAFPRNSYRAPKATTYHYKAPKLGPSHHHGYVNKSGTYVMPHYQTAPNRTKMDNWSSKPNVNPYTGKPGTKDPYVIGH